MNGLFIMFGRNQSEKNNTEIIKAAERAALYSRGESNPNRWNRNPIFYPLNYGNII